MPHFSFQFSPVTFYSARLIHNEMGNFDVGSFDNADMTKGPQNEKSENKADTEQLERRYTDAVRELEKQLGVSDLEDADLKTEMLQIKAQQEYLFDVEMLLERQAKLPQDFESITLAHVVNSPSQVRKILIQGGYEWSDLAESLGQESSHSDKKAVERAVEHAITTIITEGLIATVTPELSASEIQQFSTELKRQNQLRDLYSSQKETGSYLTNERLDSFINENAPVLLEAFRSKNKALEQLPKLSDTDPENKESIDAYLTNYLPTSDEREIVSWSELLESVQTKIANEPDPTRQKVMFEEFLQESKDHFGDSVEVQIIKAIDSDRRFKQLSFLVTTTTTVEQADRITKAIHENRVTALYSQLSGYPTSTVHNLVAEKLNVVENEATQKIASPDISSEARLVVADEFFFDSSSKPNFKPLEQWVKSSNASIFENPDGSIIIQQDEATQIQLDSDFSEQSDPEIQVLVGDGSFTETGTGKLSELDKTVERANNTLFVKYGLDAEEFIPGGLNSPGGQEVAQKLAGLFFFKERLDQKSAEQDNHFESLKSRTDNPHFRTRMAEFFGIDATIQSGVSQDHIKKKLRVFLQQQELLSPIGFIKPLNDIAWANAQSALEKYVKM